MQRKWKGKEKKNSGEGLKVENGCTDCKNYVIFRRAWGDLIDEIETLVCLVRLDMLYIVLLCETLNCILGNPTSVDIFFHASP
jgi:hypothetical protein